MCDLSPIRWFHILVLATFLSACGGGSSGSSVPPPPPTPPGGGGGPVVILSGFNTVSDAAWDETAVRKVLQVFAYGGQATDAQITSWANMPAWDAIQQMLTFEEHNPLLSPVRISNSDGLDDRSATLRGLVDFWSSDNPSNTIDPSLRALYVLAPVAWYKAAMSRGLNPFRHRIGLFETNYHMSVNMTIGVTSDQVIAYYDGITESLESGLPYQQVLANAALSAAVARQYGHFTNQWIDGVCYCNEDFAREYHQLFFGILGEYDTTYHETVAIKNTAAALTDIRLQFDTTQMDFVDFVTFGTEYHAPGPLDILNSSITGVNADERIQQLSNVAINQQESLDNLPVLFIEGLADDNMTDAKRTRIREAWNDMPQKDLLRFLRAYAVSDLFHSADRFKFFTSIDRYFVMTNGVTHSNVEANSELYTPFDGLQDEGVIAFSPRYNVFGAQTSLDAAESTSVFRTNFNRVTREHYRYRIPVSNNFGPSFTKDWSSVMSASDTGGYRVDGVTEYLWQRFVADGLKNLGTLERAHIYAFLAYDADLVYAVNRSEILSQGLDPDDLSLYDFDRVITQADLETDPALQSLLDELAAMTLDLNDTNDSLRQQANVKVGSAVNFIVATPYMFAQEGL
ncbi:MAG: DUF1800 family protein [Pseudomonadota bacterium]